MKHTARIIIKSIAKESNLKQIKQQCARLIDVEVQDVYQELSMVPEDRIPNLALARRLGAVVKDINRLLEPFGKDCSDIKGYESIAKAEAERIRFTLVRYQGLIGQSVTVNPFGTFYELHHLIMQVSTSDYPELQGLFQRAVRCLFSHSAFAPTLKNRIGKKMHLLAENSRVGCFGLHRKVKVFLDNYYQFNGFNPALKGDELLDMKMMQLEAAVTLQEMAENMESGEVFDPVESANYINSWIAYLSGLSSEQQWGVRDLIYIADHCSEVYNQRMAN